MEFLRAVRELGFLIKVDTNGCYPEVLADILDRGLADYIAMDIKNTPEKYARTTGIPCFDMKPVKESVKILMEGRTDYEFRTTVIREFHTTEDITAIGRWLKGAPRYFLQNFEDSGNLIGAGFQGFSLGEMEAMAAAAGPYFEQVKIRGL